MLRARLMEEAPSVLARNLEQYTAFEELISRDAAARLGQDHYRDTYPVLLGAATMTALRVAIAVWYRQGGDGDLTGLRRRRAPPARGRPRRPRRGSSPRPRPDRNSDR